MSNNYSDQFAEFILQELKKGAKEWRQCWRDTLGTRPINGTTLRRYRGYNWICLSLRMKKKGWKDSRFFTQKQLEAMGGHVLEGQKPTKIRFSIYRPFSDQSSNRDRDHLGSFVIRYFEVFNAEQCEGLPAFPKTFKQEWEPYETAEKVINSSGIEILYDQDSRQFYRPSEDKVHLTPRENFPKADDFYCTAFHELAHATGHESRLKRDIRNCFGSENYAREELVAEIASMMMCSKLGIASGEIENNHLGYLDSWGSILKDTPSEIIKACNAAERICQWLLSRVEVDGKLNLYEDLMMLHKVRKEKKVKPTPLQAKILTPEEIAAEAAKNKERIANNPEYARLQEQLLRMNLAPQEIKERIQLLKIGKAHLGLDHRCEDSDIPNEA